jgi:hypothetical protein
MKTCGNECADPRFLDLEVSGEAHIPTALTRGTDWIGGWVLLRAGLDDFKKRKFYPTASLHLPCNIL